MIRFAAAPRQYSAASHATLMLLMFRADHADAPDATRLMLTPLPAVTYADAIDISRHAVMPSPAFMMLLFAMMPIRYAYYVIRFDAAAFIAATPRCC